MTLTDPAAPSSHSTAPACVYIVDDDRELCASLEWLLGSVGIMTRSFYSAASFFDAYRADEVACLVLDVRMPDVSGFRLQEILNERGIGLPVIFMSAHGNIRMSVQAMHNGAFTFIEKPYEPQQIIDEVQSALAAARRARDQEQQRRRVVAMLSRLTSRELEVLKLVLAGQPSKIIGQELAISTRTVDVYRARIREKSGAESLTVLVCDIARAGVDLDDVTA